MAITLLYIHGAGNQPPAMQLLSSYNTALFGANPPPTTQIAYYADICWGPGAPPAAGAPGAGAAGPLGTALNKALKANNPVDAGQALLNLMQPGAAAGKLATAALAALGLGVAPGGPAAAGAALGADAGALLGTFIHGADTASSGANGLALPDPLFRAAAAKAGMDVARYLYQPEWRTPMRARVRQTIGAMPDPLVIVAHSLGTIITYDVLSDPTLAGRDIRLLATVGSPLGIANVMPRLRDGQGPGTVPREIQSWTNFADRFDPVACLGVSLSGKYQPADFVHDVSTLDNPAPDNHALEGYLGLMPIREAVRRALRI